MTNRWIDLLLLLMVMVFATAALANNAGVKAINGEFDASGLALTSEQHLALTGEWCFNWQQFINPQVACPSTSDLLFVPAKWNDLGALSFPRQGYASYSLILHMPTSNAPLALRIPALYRAAHIWLDGELVGQLGRPASDRAQEIPSDAEAIIPLPRNLQTVQLVIHISSFNHIDGGINKPIEIALLSELQRYERFRIASSLLMVGSSISFALYFFAVGLRAYDRYDWVNIFGAATILALSIRVIGVEQVWLMLYPAANQNWTLRFEYFGLFLSLPALLFYLYFLFPKQSLIKICYLTLVWAIASSIFTLLAPPHLYAWLRDPWVWLYPLGFIYTAVVVGLAIWQQQPFARRFGLLMVVIILTTLHDYLIWFQILQGQSLVNITYLAMILGNILLLLARQVRASRKQAQLTARVRVLNETLQEKVNRRTEQLKVQSEKLAQQNEKLLEIDELKSRFLANISHEFRTPLTLIAGPLQKLQSGQLGTLTSACTKAVTTATNNAARLSRLMEELLTLSHLESHQLKLQIRMVTANSFARRIASLFEHQALEKDIIFQTQLLKQDIKLFFDPIKMETVLFNLLANAFKYTPDKGRVTLQLMAMDQLTAEITPSEPSLIFAVQDSGPGIPNAHREKIFDRFYRLENHDRGSVEGNGIGLSLVKEITELHGGSVWLQSTHAQGATFFVALPLGFQHFKKEEFCFDPAVEHPDIIENPAPQALAKEPTSDAKETKTLLLVEDIADMRDYIADHFDKDYQVLTAKHGEQALEILSNHSVDAMVTDLMMPVMDGMELLNRVRQSDAFKDLPILMLSARSSSSTRNSALAAQANDYLEKPFDSEELVLRVRNLFRNSGGNSSAPAVALTSADQRFLATAQQTVMTQLANSQFDAKKLAQLLNVSKATLHRHLEKAANTTPAAFIRDIRLRHAHELIVANSHRTLAEVAYAVGFNSPGYFSRLYKQRYDEAD